MRATGARGLSRAPTWRIFSSGKSTVRLRRSLTEQIIAAYLQVTGRAKKLSPFENVVAIGIGNSIADPFVAQLVTPESAGAA